MEDRDANGRFITGNTIARAEEIEGVMEDDGLERHRIVYSVWNEYEECWSAWLNEHDDQPADL